MDKEKEKQKRIKEVAKHLHPHDDEPDPTAYMGNYNFPQMLFAFCLGVATMFVASVNEMNKLKGCPLPAYFNDPLTFNSLVRAYYGKPNRVRCSFFRIDRSSYYWYGYGSQVWMGALGTV